MRILIFGIFKLFKLKMTVFFFSVEAAGRLALLRHSSSQDAKILTLPLY
jgi:hypothetical protein